MKKLFTLILPLIIAIGITAQERPDFRNDYYVKKRAEHESRTVSEGAIAVFGNSITERGKWNEYFPGKEIVNWGIGGDKVYGMIDRMPYVADTKPSRLFVMAGINDLIFTSVTLDVFEKEYRELIKIVKDRSPETKIYIQSILPVNENVKESNKIYFKDKNEKIKQFNKVVKAIAKEFNLTYIDVNKKMLKKGLLNAEYTDDGIHLNAKGYAVWVSQLKKYF